ncbi:MAG: type IV secretory pathway protein, partial [Thaumarchaeota archaeon]|nr:type IV secretory pathway protein [Nitrososphaerota archaeon]
MPTSQELEQPANKTTSDTIPIEFSESVPKFISVNKLEFVGTEIHGGVIRDPTSIGGLRYLIIQPRLSINDKKNFDLIKKLLITELSISLTDIKSKEDAEKRLRKKIIQLIKKYRLEIPTKNLSKIAYYAIRDFIYLGKIEPLMRDH